MKVIVGEKITLRDVHESSPGSVILYMTPWKTIGMARHMVNSQGTYWADDCSGDLPESEFPHEDFNSFLALFIREV